MGSARNCISARCRSWPLRLSQVRGSGRVSSVQCRWLTVARLPVPFCMTVDVLFPPACASVARLLVPLCAINDTFVFCADVVEVAAVSALGLIGVAIFAAETASRIIDWTMGGSCRAAPICETKASLAELLLAVAQRRVARMMIGVRILPDLIGWRTITDLS